MLRSCLTYHEVFWEGSFQVGVCVMTFQNLKKILKMLGNLGSNCLFSVLKRNGDEGGYSKSQSKSMGKWQILLAQYGNDYHTIFVDLCVCVCVCVCMPVRVHICVCDCVLTIGFARIGARSWVTPPPQHPSTNRYTINIVAQIDTIIKKIKRHKCVKQKCKFLG